VTGLSMGAFGSFDGPGVVALDVGGGDVDGPLGGGEVAEISFPRDAARAASICSSSDIIATSCC